MSVPARILWMMLSTAAVAVIVIISLMIWMAGQTNLIAQTQTKTRVSITLDVLVENHAVITQDYAYWELPLSLFQQRDDAGLYDNVGSGASESDAFDLIYLVAPDGTVNYAYGSDVWESDLAFVDPDIVTHLLPPLSNVPLEPYSTVSGLMVRDGQLTMVAAGRIQPDDVSDLMPSDLPVMIGVKSIAPATFGQSLLLENLQFTPANSAQPDDRASLVLRDMRGETIGTLSWTPPRPGQSLLRHALPVVLTLAALMIAASWRIGRIASGQARDYLREKARARIDAATGVLNRTGLAELARDPDMQAALTAGRAAFIYVDMNGLKEINDTYGHTVGDTAIATTAKRLRGAIRVQDHVGRLGGDEFVCIVIDDNASDVVEAVAQRIAHRTAQSFTVLDQSILASASIGIALSGPGLTWETLMDQADEAMYHAKRQNMRDPLVFDAQLQSAS